MIDALNIVKGGVSKKGLDPILTHLRIKGGWVTASNGNLTITAPFPERPDLDITVPADKFIRSLSKHPKANIKVNESTLSISHKRFRAFLPLITDSIFPMPTVTGEVVNCTDLVETLKKLYQFIGNDASRSWANGILVRSGFAYATNNVILAETKTSWDGITVNLPYFIIDELLRIKKPIEHIQVNEGSITIRLEGDIWINSKLISTRWPDIHGLLEKADFSRVQPLPEGVREGIEAVAPFCPHPSVPKIIFSEEGIGTEDGVHKAFVDMEGLLPSCWRSEPLLNLLERGKIDIDLSTYPRPSPWVRDDGVRGLIIGLRN